MGQKKPSSSSSSELIAERASEINPTEAVETASVMIHSHSGPLPDPKTLEYYERVIPGAAREILDMAKSEQRHRHRLNWAGIGMSIFGQVAAVFIAVLGLGGGIFLAYSGCAFTGLTTFIGTLAALAGVTAYDRKNKKKAVKAHADQQESAAS